MSLREVAVVERVAHAGERHELHLSASLKPTTHAAFVAGAVLVAFPMGLVQTPQQF
jgi:hypothetical protein